MFGSTINISVAYIPCRQTDPIFIIWLFFIGDHKVRTTQNIKKALQVCIYHTLPVAYIAILYCWESCGKPGIIYQHINFFNSGVMELITSFHPPHGFWHQAEAQLPLRHIWIQAFLTSVKRSCLRPAIIILWPCEVNNSAVLRQCLMWPRD